MTEPRHLPLALQLAQARLVEIALNLAPVQLVDIGRDEMSGEPVLRVHLRPGTDIDALGLPSEVDGVAVQLLAGDYRLQ